MIQKSRQCALIFSVLLVPGLALADDAEECTRHFIASDYQNAMPFCKLAAKQGNANAQHNLGMMYYNGRGVLQNKRRAAKWYRLAAERGIASAQFKLALMYDKGNGVLQDRHEAVKWYHLAAEQGYAIAQVNLGVMYALGKGVLPDNKEAYIWFSLAAITGHEKAVKGREMVERHLTRSEIDSALQEAKRRLAEIDSRDI